MDGFLSLALSLLVGAITLGVTHLWLLLQVVRTGKHATAYSGSVSALAVLGKQLDGQGGISTDYRLRLNRVLALCAGSKKPDILVVGGGISGDTTEARAGTAYLVESGVESGVIVREELSENTLENLRHARSWFDEHPQALIISNRYHLLRVMTMAAGLGLTISPCAAEERCVFWNKLPHLMLEAVFLHWYWSGRIFAQLTNNRRMLEKIR